MTYIVHTQVDLKFGQNPGFNEVLTELKAFLAKHGWKLVYGLQPMVGKLNEVIHVWEVENFEDVGKGLSAAASDPEILQHLARLPDLMNSENVQVMVKTPYSP